MKIAFDLDNTLIKKSNNGEDIPNYGAIFFLHMFLALNDVRIFVWSWSGIDYAKRWVEKLWISENVKVIVKGSIDVDIAVDDEEVNLGKVNIRI